MSTACKAAFFWSICAIAQLAVAQTNGSFAPAGKMTAARYAHTATLLNDGRVLIAGGFGSDGAARKSAEIYDPANGTFAPTGDLSAPRANHRALLLPDGRVMIAGGDAGVLGGGPLPPVEIYDPSTAAFTRLPGLAFYLGTLTLLSDGQVLITGERPPEGTFLAQLYDPSTGALTPAADAVPPRPGLWATSLADGRVLFNNPGFSNGGSDTGGQLYDAATRTFTPTGDDDEYNATTLLVTGQVLLIRTDDVGTEALLYDARTRASTPAGRLKRPILAATTLSDGTVLLFPAGQKEAPSLYSPSEGALGDVLPPLEARTDPAPTLLNSGQVLLTGGYTVPDVGPPGPPLPAIDTAELYTPAAVAPPPALFSIGGDDPQQGAIWNAATGQLASPEHPAAPGDVLAMYTTSLVDGGVIPPQVAVGGRLAGMLYFGPAPGYPGYNQVNFRVPEGVPAGSRISVRLSYLGRVSNAVSIAVQ